MVVLDDFGQGDSGQKDGVQVACATLANSSLAISTSVCVCVLFQIFFVILVSLVTRCVGSVASTVSVWGCCLVGVFEISGPTLPWTTLSLARS